MSAPRLFHKKFYLPLNGVEWSLLEFYSWQYNRERQDTLRAILMGFVNRDKSFDVDKFEDFVKKDLRRTLKGEDKELVDRYIKQAEEYIAKRRSAKG